MEARVIRNEIERLKYENQYWRKNIKNAEKWELNDLQYRIDFNQNNIDHIKMELNDQKDINNNVESTDNNLYRLA